MTTRICTWFLSMEGPGRNPTNTANDVYLRNAVTFFATSIRNNPKAKHVFFTNIARLPKLAGLEVQGFLESLGVDFVILPYRYVPPVDYGTLWRSQFYQMGVIEFLSENSSLDDAILVFDTDCIWVSNVETMADQTRSAGYLSYDTGFSEFEDSNGLSRHELGEVCESLDSSRRYQSPSIAGGEIIGITGESAAKFATQIPVLWEQLMSLHAEGKKKLLMDEHWLTYLYLKNGAQIGNANPFIRRIWTSIPPKIRDAHQSDLDLAIWHLPAEKRYGLSRLYTQVINRDSAFWNLPLGRPFAKYLGSYLGVPRRTIKKALWDIKDGIVWKWGKVTQK